MNTTAETLHPFEARGLGKAPFRYVGMEHQEISYGQRVIGSAGGIPITTKPGGTCAYCHTYIVNMFQVESSDGNRFHVGCDCIDKVAGVAPIANTAKMGDELKAHKKAIKLARENARIEAAKARADHPALKCRPHPNAFRSSEGDTLADYVAWLLRNGGQAGKLKAAHIVEAATAPKAEE